MAVTKANLKLSYALCRFGTNLPYYSRSIKQALIVSAMLVPTLLLPASSEAQSAPEGTKAKIKYVYYKDRQSGGGDRVKVKTPMLWFDTPLDETLEMEGGVVLDSVSGASPLYLDTLSGASGTRIHDTRNAGDLKFTKYFDGFSLGVGGALSEEHDYRSRSGSIESRIWNEDKTRTFTIGTSRDWDNVSSSNDPALHAAKQTQHYIIGVTQIIDPISIIQSNITYGSGSGYFTDPYKLFDIRPKSRDEWAWLTRYVRFIKETEGSLHADYRLYSNSWGVTSHTFDLQYYQPIGESFILRPSARYYIQNRADFFSEDIPPREEGHFISADQRLSEFGGLSLGLKLIAKLTKELDLDLLYEHIQQDESLKPGAGSSDIRSFSAHYFEIGLTKRF